MNRAAQGIIKNALAEQMEKEAAMVPSDERIQEVHRFSKKFLKNMERLKQNILDSGKQNTKKNVRQNGRAVRGKEQDVSIWKRKEKISEKRRMYISIAALCVCCLIAVGVTWRGRMISDKAADNGGTGMENSMATEAQDTAAAESSAESPGSEEEAGWMPFIELTSEEIAKVEVTISDEESAKKDTHTEAQEKLAEDTEAQWEELTDILNSMTVYEEIGADALQEMRAEYHIQRMDGTDIMISVYDDAVVINSDGYMTDEETCRRLILLAEKMQQTTRRNRDEEENFGGVYSSWGGSGNGRMRQFRSSGFGKCSVSQQKCSRIGNGGSI